MTKERLNMRILLLLEQFAKSDDCTQEEKELIFNEKELYFIGMNDDIHIEGMKILAQILKYDY